jgi:hypothetical protein
MDQLSFDTCLCCGGNVNKPGAPITSERAERALIWFEAMGYTRADLLTKHRAQLEFQAPGFVEWLEARH